MKNSVFKKSLCFCVVMLMLIGNFAFADNKVKKDESVYITLDSNGVVKERIVSDWIHVDGNIKEVNDVSILKNIINLKGNELPEIDGNKVNWKPSGSDVFYQGTTDEKLPIEVKIKYYLDGKEISSKNIAGKTGKIKITIELINKEIHHVTIRGKKKDIYTEFTTVGLLNLPVSNFKNVKVNSGEIISDGNNQAVAFVSFPGLLESLGLKKDIIDLPKQIIINADAKNFELGAVMIAVSPKFPDVKDFDTSKTIDDLTKGMKELTDASKKLSEGAAKLFTINLESLNKALGDLSNGSKDLKAGIAKIGDGANSLKDGSEQVTEGIKKLSDSAGKLGEGADNLGKGAVEYGENSLKFADGAAKAADGVSQIAAKTGELSDGLNKLVDATDQIKLGQSNIAKGAADALGGLSELKAAKQKEIAVLDLLITGIDGLKKAVALIGGIPAAKDLSDKLMGGLDQQLTGLKGLRDSGDKFLAGLSKLEMGIAAMKDGTEKLSAGLENLQAAQKNAASGASKLSEAGKGLVPAAQQLQGGAKNLYDGAVKLKDGGTNLSDGAKQFSDGSKVLVDGSVKVSEGLSGLAQGTGKLSEGAAAISDGLSKASEGSSKLLKGSKDILKGTNDLSSNMKKFDSDGILKLNNKVMDGADYANELLDIKDELVKLSKDYKTFSGIGKDMDGTVKFIYKTDEIKLPGKK